jgi:hypothetical protein
MLGFSRQEWIDAHVALGYSADQAIESTDSMLHTVSSAGDSSEPVLGISPQYLTALAGLSEDARVRVLKIVDAIPSEALDAFERAAPGFLDVIRRTARRSRGWPENQETVEGTN